MIINGVNVKLEVKRYTNGNLAVQAWCDEGPYCTVTTNLGKKLKPDMAYIDINNCGNNIIYELIDAGLLIPLREFDPMCDDPDDDTERYEWSIAFSEYCAYPIVKFDIDKIANA